MEVEEKMEEGTEAVISTGATGSVSVSLHPLVVMNVSDHYTRVKVQSGSANTTVFGALLGRQKGRSVEICNSYELLVERVEEQYLIDQDYFTSKEEQFKQVFPDMEFVGWYTNGDTPTSDDTLLHEQISQERENSLLLKLNTSARTSQLPIAIFESLLEVEEGKTKVMFSFVPYTLATEEAERVGVDHIARVSVTGSAQNSAVADQLSGTHGAVKMLHTRVRLILDYLKSVQSGELPHNYSILREISSLCDQLPVLNNQVFEQSFQDQTSEVLQVSYLASITKGIETTNEFVAKINTIHDRHGMTRRGRGLLF